MEVEFSDLNVLVVGDVILDRYFMGGSDRISPEAPIPVVMVDNTQDKLGGAANVANNLKALGANVCLLGMVGHDTYADVLSSLVQAQGIDYDFQAIPKKHTITKARVISRHQQMLRLDFENSFAEVDKATLLEKMNQKLSTVDIVLFSDYLKGTLSDVESWIQLCRAAGKKVIVDPKGFNFLRYKNASVLTPNQKEFEAIVGACGTQDILRHKATKLIKKLSLEALLITQGENGMTLVKATGEPFHQTTKSAEVVDVTGAGDTVVATFALAMAKGYPLERCAYLANIGAGIVVKHLGTAVLSKEELVHRLGLGMSASSVLSVPELKRRLDAERKRNNIIVMTNGCFDILHLGHVDYLNKARALGDCLVVAVNVDETVSALKGDKRPYNKLADRMNMLAALESVSFVVAFSEKTPWEIVTLLKPDVYVKGGDYQLTDLKGSDAVAAYGGKVMTTPLEYPEKSTTGLIQAILKNHKETV